MTFGLIQIAYAASDTLKGKAIDSNTLIQNVLNNIVNPVISLLIALAVLYFLWGMFNFIRNAESSDERKKGGMNMLWGAIGLFIMVTAYGVLNLILGTLGK